MNKLTTYVLVGLVGEALGWACLGLWVYCYPAPPPERINLACKIPSCPTWYRKVLILTAEKEFQYSFYDLREQTEDTERQRTLNYVKLQLSRIKVLYVLSFFGACLEQLFPVSMLSLIVSTALVGLIVQRPKTLDMRN